jgi:CheY-like chemotaxis protein
MLMEKQNHTSSPAILIADNNQGIVRLLGDLLTNAGYLLAAAYCGKQVGSGDQALFQSKDCGKNTVTSYASAQ